MTLKEFYTALNECIQFAKENGTEIRHDGFGVIIGYGTTKETCDLAVAGSTIACDELMADCFRAVTTTEPIVEHLNGGIKS